MRSNSQRDGFPEIKKQLEEIKTLLRKQDDKPLNFNQAAEYLGFSHSYLYKLTSRKIIPCHRPTGKMLFFSKAELDEWIFTSKKSKLKSKKRKTISLDDEEEDNDDADSSTSLRVTKTIERR